MDFQVGIPGDNKYHIMKTSSFPSRCSAVRDLDVYDSAMKIALKD